MVHVGDKELKHHIPTTCKASTNTSTALGGLKSSHKYPLSIFSPISKYKLPLASNYGE